MANFIGQDGTSRTLSNAHDRDLLIHLRKLSDLIVTDAATANAENYRASKWTEIEVWSRSGQFGSMVSTTTTEEFKSLTTVQIDDLRDAVRSRLTNRENLLFESGPTLSKALGTLGLVDELCLTIANCRDVASARATTSLVTTKLRLDYLAVEHIKIFGDSAFMRLSR